MAKRDYYDVLNIKPDATDAEVKSAYRALAMRWHPDRNGSLNANSRFREIHEAYECLKDANKRAAHDLARQRARRYDESKKQPPPPPRSTTPPWRAPQARARPPLVLFAIALVTLIGWQPLSAWVPTHAPKIAAESTEPPRGPSEQVLGEIARREEEQQQEAERRWTAVFRHASEQARVLAPVLARWANVAHEVFWIETGRHYALPDPAASRNAVHLP